MNSLGTAKKQRGDFRKEIARLYRSTSRKLHALLLRISKVLPRFNSVISVSVTPCYIALAPKRVIYRFWYPRKFALFTGIMVIWPLGGLTGHTMRSLDCMTVRLSRDAKTKQTV